MRKDGMLPGGIDNHGYTPTLGKGSKQVRGNVDKWNRNKVEELLHKALTGQINTDNTSTRPSAYISYDNSNSIA